MELTNKYDILIVNSLTQAAKYTFHLKQYKLSIYTEDELVGEFVNQLRRTKITKSIIAVQWFLDTRVWKNILVPNNIAYYFTTIVDSQTLTYEKFVKLCGMAMNNVKNSSLIDIVKFDEINNGLYELGKDTIALNSYLQRSEDLNLLADNVLVSLCEVVNNM